MDCQYDHVYEETKRELINKISIINIEIYDLNNFATLYHHEPDRVREIMTDVNKLELKLMEYNRQLTQFTMYEA